MIRVENFIGAILKNEAGQDLIEYALIAGLLALSSVLALTTFSNQLSNLFNSVGNSLTNAS